MSAKLKVIVDSGYGSVQRKTKKPLQKVAAAPECGEQKHGTLKEAESNRRGLKSKQI
jgi:hypothetical protein